MHYRVDVPEEGFEFFEDNKFYSYILHSQEGKGTYEIVDSTLILTYDGEQRKYPKECYTYETLFQDSIKISFQNINSYRLWHRIWIVKLGKNGRERTYIHESDLNILESNEFNKIAIPSEPNLILYTWVEQHGIKNLKLADSGKYSFRCYYDKNTYNNYYQTGVQRTFKLHKITKKYFEYTSPRDGKIIRLSKGQRTEKFRSY